MASNYNRKSGSSGSRKAKGKRSRGVSVPRGTRSSQPRTPQMPSQYRAIPGGRASQQRTGRSAQGQASGYSPVGTGHGQTSVYGSSPQLTSVRVGDLDQERQKRLARSHRRMVIRLSLIAALVVALVGGGLALYWSNLFTVETITVQGVEHLTATEMTELAGVPAGTTLLRVDAGGIEQRLLADAWVRDVSVNRVFPNTLELVITERTITAVVEVPTETAQTTRQWAIASDGMWLMPIPARDSDAGKSISPKIYEDAEAVLHIVDVPYGTSPEIGTYCNDSNVNNALAIVDGMTTSLSDQVRVVSATDPASTTLTLDNGVEIVFGAAEDIRSKERVCLELMSQNEGKIAYINVRVVDRPTWRSL